MTTTVTTSFTSLLLQLRTLISPDRSARLDALFEEATSPDSAAKDQASFMTRLREIATKEEMKTAVNELLSGNQASSAAASSYTGPPPARSPRVLAPPTTRATGAPPAKRSRKSAADTADENLGSGAGGWGADERLNRTAPLMGMPPLTGGGTSQMGMPPLTAGGMPPRWLGAGYGVGSGPYAGSFPVPGYGPSGHGTKFSGGSGSELGGYGISPYVVDAIMARSLLGNMGQGVLSGDMNAIPGMINGAGMPLTPSNSGQLTLEQIMRSSSFSDIGFPELNRQASAGELHMSGVPGGAGQIDFSALTAQPFGKGPGGPNLSLSLNRDGLRAQNVSELSISGFMDIASGEGGTLTSGELTDLLAPLGPAPPVEC